MLLSLYIDASVIIACSLAMSAGRRRRCSVLGTARQQSCYQHVDRDNVRAKLINHQSLLSASIAARRT